MTYRTILLLSTLAACNSDYDFTPLHVAVVCDSSGETPACNTDLVIQVLRDNFAGSENTFPANPESTFSVFLTSGSTGSMKGNFTSDPFPVAYGRKKGLAEEWLKKVESDIRSLNLIVDDSKNNSDIIGGIIVASDSLKGRDGNKHLHIISDGRQIGGEVNLEKAKGTAESAVKRLDSAGFQKFSAATMCGMSYSGISEKNFTYAKSFWTEVSGSIADGNFSVEASCNNS